MCEVAAALRSWSPCMSGKEKKMQRKTSRAALITAIAAMLLSLAGVAAAYDDDTALTGTVINVNRDLNYVTVRDQATGQSVKVDVRRMDTRRSVNVWQLRTGELVTVNGRWANKNNGNFRADFVNFAGNSASMTSGSSSPNVIIGTVESVNRE